MCLPPERLQRPHPRLILTYNHNRSSSYSETTASIVAERRDGQSLDDPLNASLELFPSLRNPSGIYMLNAAGPIRLVEWKWIDRNGQ